MDPSRKVLFLALFSKSPLLGRLESPLLLIKSLKDKVENLEIRSIEMLIFALLKMDQKQGKLNSIMNRILKYAMNNRSPSVYEKRFVFLELALFYSIGGLAKQYIEKIIRDYLANSKSMPLEDTITLTRKIGLLDTQEDVIIERLVSVTLDNIDAFEPDSFLKQYMNLSRVGICNKELFKKVSNQECLKAFKKLTMNEKSAIFWEMVKSVPKKRYRTLLLPFFKALDLEQCSNSSSKNCMVLSYHTLEAVYKIDFLPKVKEQIAIFERELIQLQKNEVQANKAHQDISQTLIKMEIEHENEAFVLGFFVDILIKEPKIIIEVDGKSHDMYRRRLSDKVKNEVLRANGYLLLRLSVDAFSDLPEDELKSMIRIKLNDLLKSAEEKGATGSAQKRKISNYEKGMKRKRSG
jgi:very-short-patch-repair endonuclease